MGIVRPVLDVRLNPSCDQRIATTPRPIRAKLRIAWNATCGSSAHACTTRSPSLIPGFNSSAANGGSAASAAGQRAASPNRSTPSRSNSVGPKPNVTVSREASRSNASPVSTGGAKGSPSMVPTGRPAHISAAASVHSRIRSRSSRGSSVVTSNAAISRRSCGGVSIPA